MLILLPWRGETAPSEKNRRRFNAFLLAVGGVRPRAVTGRPKASQLRLQPEDRNEVISIMISGLLNRAIKIDVVDSSCVR